MSKRKIKLLCSDEKLKILHEYEHSGAAIDEVCLKFGVGKSMLYKIIQNKKKIQSKWEDGQGKLKRIRLAEFPNVEKCLVTWIKQCLQNNILINGPLIKQKAQDFACKLEINNFSASKGWLYGSKKRN